MLALRTAAEFQKLGKAVAWLDSEAGFSPKFAKLVGVDPDKIVLSQISAGEDAFDIIDALLETEVSLIVIDSVASQLTTL